MVIGRRRMSTRNRLVLTVAALVVAVLTISACLPARPASGRSTPVRRVLVLGDSISYGLYGTTPRVHEPLAAMLADRGVGLRVTGFPGETPIDTWPGHLAWSLRMRHEIAAWDPDVVVIQSTLFPAPDSPARRAAYRRAMTELLGVATSRGAHVYLVAHAAPPGGAERHQRDVAQQLQAEAAAGRGVSTIPLDWWLGRCQGGVVADGWHLSATGQRCHALAVTLAVDQLRDVTG